MEIWISAENKVHLHQRKIYNIMEIKKVIKAHGLTMVEVARRMGVNKGTLSNTIRNENMLVGTLRNIAQAVGCSISEFFADEETERNTAESQNKREFSALIDMGGQLYHTDSLSQLEAFISASEEKEK